MGLILRRQNVRVGRWIPVVGVPLGATGGTINGSFIDGTALSSFLFCRTDNIFL